MQTRKLCIMLLIVIGNCYWNKSCNETSTHLILLFLSKSMKLKNSFAYEYSFFELFILLCRMRSLTHLLLVILFFEYYSAVTCIISNNSPWKGKSPW